MRKNLELTKDWKVPLPASLAGRVEMTLTDPLTRQPKYGARTRLIASLLEHWLDVTAGKLPTECRPLPTLEDLRSL